MRLARWIAVGLAAAALPALADDRSFPAECGKPVTEVLEGADRVETFRVAPGIEDPPPEKNVLGHPVRLVGKAFGAEFAAKILAACRHNGTTFPGMKECAMEPGFAFRIWKGKTAVEMLLCYTCQQIKIVRHPEKGDAVEITGDFDGATTQWLALCREAFPEDVSVRGLTAMIEGPKPEVRALFGDFTLGILRAHFLSRIYRVKAKAPGKEDAAGHEITATSEEIPREAYLGVPAVLLDEKSWDFAAKPAADFRPDVNFLLLGQDDAVLEVLVCLSTGDIEFSARPAKGGEPVHGRGNCAGGRAALLAFAKGALPEDTELQAIPEKK